MGFLYPAFLIGALAIAVPIALHLLRRDVAPEVPFTAVRLLRKSPVEIARRRRLRDFLLLAARVVALLLLAAAFARPYLRAESPPALRVVAIDTSVSMGGADRFERARGLARAALDEAGRGERVALLAFDDRALVLSPPGAAADARAALANAQPGPGGTRYRAVIDKVGELADGTLGRLVLVTDLQQSGLDAAADPARLPPGWTVDIRDVGPVAANAAVAGVRIEPGRVIASIRNTGTTDRAGAVRVAIDGRDAASAPYALTPGATTDIAVAAKPPQTGTLSVVIEDPGGLGPDDARHTILGGTGVPEVLIVSNRGLYLSRVLEAPSETESKLDAQVVAGDRVSVMDPQALSRYRLVALLSTRGLDRRGREAIAAHVRAGAGLFVAAGPDVDPEVLASMTAWSPAIAATEASSPALTLAVTDLRHPIFRPFGGLAANLGQVRFDRYWRVAPGGWSVMARFSNGAPALLERGLDRGRVVLFASDVDRRWNDFPLNPSFVPFALEAVRYTSPGRPATREFVVADAPAGAGPGPGLFRLGDNRIVAVNVDLGEIDPVRLGPEGLAARIEARDGQAGGLAPEALLAAQTEAQQSYWQYGLLVMIAALVAESFVGRS